jgi:glycosyltransferase involved in cell wall biosynthesis
LNDQPPKVTVGLPVYNGEDHLAEAIECHLDQTFENFTLLIVDNASTDATPTISQEFVRQDQRVQYIRNDKNIGLAANFNKVLQKARSPYFTWAAHDDLYAPEFLERCVAALDDNPSAVLAHTKIQGIDRNGSPHPYDSEQKGFIVNRHRGDIRYYDVERWNEGLASDDAATRFGTAVVNIDCGIGRTIFGLIRTPALKRARYRPYGMENLLAAELSLEGTFQYIDEPLFFFRMHRENLGLTSRAELMEVNLGHRPDHLFPLKTFLNYVSAVKNADLTGIQRLRCMWAILRRSLSPASLRRLFIPGPLNYWGLNFGSERMQNETTETSNEVKAALNNQ